MSYQAFVLLGSNLDKERNMRAALQLLSARCQVTRVSSFYETAPVGNTDRPTYLNAAVLLRTTLSASELKWQHLRPIEALLGRVRTSDPYAPRTIDLDLVLYENHTFELDGSLIPDPNILKYAHVAIPLAEIAPAFIHPLTTTPLGEIAASCSDRSNILRRFSERP